MCGNVHCPIIVQSTQNKRETVGSMSDTIIIALILILYVGGMILGFAILVWILFWLAGESGT